jgi:putative hemolysin
MKAKIVLTMLFIIMLIGCQQSPDEKIVDEPNATQEVVAAECKTNEDCVPEKPLVGAQYLCEEGKCIQKPFGNPASMKCVEDNGTIEMRENEAGQYGVCIFSDGTECEEWAYFKGECPAVAPEGCGLEPVYLRSECCQKKLKCDVVKIAVYTSATGQCSCEGTDVKRQCAAVQCDRSKFSMFDPNMGECVCVQSGTGVVEAGPKVEMNEITTWQEAKQAVLDAFDAKWRKIPDGCGKYEDGMMTPDKIAIEETGDGWTAKIEYYCGLYQTMPDEPDHKKEITVTRDGRVSGL